MVQVYKETGKFNCREAYRRRFPHHSPKCAGGNAHRDMGNEMVMDEVNKMLYIKDKDLLRKVKPEVIVQDLLCDLKVLNDLRDKFSNHPDEIVKILMAKAPKQKMLGAAIALWKAERPVEREEAAGELMEALGKFGTGRRN